MATPFYDPVAQDMQTLAPQQASTSTGNFVDDTDAQTDSPDSGGGASTDSNTPPPTTELPPQDAGDDTGGDTTSPPPDQNPPPVGGDQGGGQQGGTTGGYQGTGDNGFYGGPPYPYNYGDSNPGTGYVGTGGMAGEGTPDEPGNIGEDLGNWQPGQVYTGTGNTSGDFLMTDETFTPMLGEDEGPQPVNWNVTDEQTVQGQMNSIVGNMSGNPVFQSLAASLERAQASHGGENSLMAETAAYNGVVNMAFQIASADAATYARSAEFNASTANQFSLSNRQFMQQALLSTQNYQQAQVLQAQQIQGNLQSVSMQIAGQIKSTEIGANAQIASAQIGAAAQRAAAATSASATLRAADIQRQTALDSIQANFQASWALSEQQQSHNLELNDRTTDNQIRHDLIGANANFGQALTLQMNADQNANLRQLMGGVSQIGSTPGLTGAQQANAINQLTQMYHTNSSMGASFYGSSSYSLASGQVGANIMNGTNATPMNTGVAPAKAGGTTSSGGGAAPWSVGGSVGEGGMYQQYGDYLSYGQGGYTMTAAPQLEFYGGDGLVHSQGGIATYGSNLAYENATGNTVGYNNQLTGNNPLGNAPGRVTGGANYFATPNSNEFLPEGYGGGG